MNRRANLYVIAFIIIGAMALLTVGLMLAIGGAVVKESVDTIVPEWNSIGEISPGRNVSEYARYVTTPATTIMDNVGLVMGLTYLLGIVGLFSFACMFRGKYNGLIIALFIACVFLVMLFCILISNTYEEFYNMNDAIGQTLQENSLISYMILYSPAIMSLVVIIAGIILFTGGGGEYYA